MSLSNRILFGKFLLFIVLLATSLVFSYLNDFVNLGANRMGSYFYFYVASFSGIGLCILVSKAIPENMIFSFVGRNSLAILALHLPAYLVIRGVEKVMVRVVGLTIPGMSLWSMMFYSIIQLLMTVPIIYVINRYLLSRAMLIPHPRGHGYSPLFPVRVVVSSVSSDSVSSYTILLRQS